MTWSSGGLLVQCKTDIKRDITFNCVDACFETTTHVKCNMLLNLHCHVKNTGCTFIGVTQNQFGNSQIQTFETIKC